MRSVLSRFPSIFTANYDIALLTDLRFPGGSGSSTAQELRIQHLAGLRTALFHVPSPQMGPLPKTNTFRNRKKASPKIQDCLERRYATFVKADAKVYAPLTIMRHPTIANSVRFLPKRLRTDEVIVVINHPAARGNGVIDYELSTVSRNIESVLGVRPKLCPISPVIANACRGPESQNIQIDNYWSNIFEIPPEHPRQRSVGEPIIIGRHSRDSRDKWPADATTLRQVYPLADGIHIKVLGGAEIPRSIMGGLPANWQVLSFDPFGTESFLKSIDVYVYFHHPAWTEAFGRAPCEAMLAGIPTILPKTFEPTFGNAAIYCEHAEVLAMVRKLQNDPKWYAEVAMRGRLTAAKQFGSARHIERLRSVRNLAQRLNRVSAPLAS